MKLRQRLVCILSAMLLSACGGSDHTANQSASPSATVAGAGSVSGVAVASDTGKVLSDVQVFIGNRSVTTSANGGFSQEGLAANDRVVLRFVKAGYVDTFVATAINSELANNIVARLTPVIATTTFDNTTAGYISDDASGATVSLPTSSLINNATGAAPIGQITASIGVINPATDPANMPGDYTTSSGERIESFGALAVQLRDSLGNRLNLAPGQVASISIPLSTRSSSPPPTIPLYYFDETTGLWVEEGSATLQGTPSRQYYAGTVRHFTIWNADIRTDTVLVNGCIAGSDDTPFAANYVKSEGIDYSGAGNALSTASGKFSIAIRRNSIAKIEAVFPRSSAPVIAGPFAADTTLANCLTLSSATTAVTPSVFLDPRSLGVKANSNALFLVVALGTNLKYQWLRNGLPIAGATNAYYAIPKVSDSDNGALYSVVVTNDAGSVTSNAAILTVYPQQVVYDSNASSLIRLSYLSFDLYSLAFAPFSNFTNSEGDKWIAPLSACSSGTASGLLNGQPIVANVSIPTSATIIGSYNNCKTINDPDETLTGTATIQYNSDAQFLNATASSQVVNMRRRSVNDQALGAGSNITANGAISVIENTTLANGQKTTAVLMTPGPGSTLRNDDSGQSITFISGTTRAKEDDATINVKTNTLLEQSNLTFSFNGDTYVSNGAIAYTTDRGMVSGSGQIGLTKNGVLIGRIFATSQGLFYEAGGEVQSFYNLVLPAPQKLRAMRK